MVKSRWLHILVDLPARTLNVQFRYWPPRKQRHVGADSPGYLDAGRADFVDQIRLFENWIDVSAEFGPRTSSAIKQAVREAARLRPMPVRISLVPSPGRPSFCCTEKDDDTDQFPLPIEDGHLRRAMERTE